MKPRKKRTDKPLSARVLKGGWRSWVASKKSVFGFCGKFSLLTLLYYGVLMLPFCDQMMSGYLVATARIAHGILHVFGEASQITEATIWSSRHAITVLPSCAALELVWFFSATVIAYPAAFARKAGGILAGVPLILALNLARIVTLYSVGVHFHGYFDTIHEEVWPMVLIIATILICTGWIKWARAATPIGTDVTA